MPKVGVTLGRVPTPAALPLPTVLLSAKGPQAGQQLRSGRCQEPLGWQGFALPCPTPAPRPGSAATRALCRAAPPLCTSHVKCGQAPRLPREEEEGGRETRYPELGRKAHRPISQRPTSLLAHHQRSPEAGVCSKGGASPRLGEEELGFGGREGIPWQAGGSRCALLLLAGSRSLFVCPCLAVLCRRV